MSGSSGPTVTGESIGWSGRQPADAADVKIDLFAAIRRDSRAGMSVRALARKYEINRRTVRAASASAWPAPPKPMPPRPSRLDSFTPVIDDILRADLDAPAKQRHTVKRIYDRLIDEYGMQQVSYAVVRRYDNLRAAVARSSASPGTASRPPDGPPSARTMRHKPSIASQVCKASTRRAASKARSAGSAATTWSPSLL
ncbi:hypothetical protein AB0F81_42230 [Actinoplanes sp. NPDC024001]|uniref:hypothetical protein n=1 Tax=Actinoplanes sp. NPDC024001 TaxID=3154598 RepID=UPI0033E880B4